MKIQAHSIKKLAKTSLSALPEALIVLVSEKTMKGKKWVGSIPHFYQHRVENALARLHEPLKAGGTLKVSGMEKLESDVFISVLPEDKSSFSLLGFARGVLGSAISHHTKSLAVGILEGKDEQALADCFGAALAIKTFQMPLYGKRLKDKKVYKLAKVELYSSKKVDAQFNYGLETGNGTNMVRKLGTLPPNELSANSYGATIRKIAKDHRLTVKFYSNTQLKKMGAGAFTAVDQGDPNSKGGIYELSYNPKKAKNKKVVTLVGKGLCYDTGGYDIKTGGYMLGMKGDMIGSAVALSTIATASKLKVPLKMKAFLAVTENHVSPKAYKADEIIIALNGISIEVINTDAEGRMVLADTLTLASRAKPDIIVDFATLTGTAMVAIGTNYSAGFTNKEEFHSKMIKAGKTSGERVWPFPIDKDYGKALKSPIADTIQCIKSRGPDHILAAYFLSRFVENKVPWVHIDLAAAEKEGGLAHIGSGFTGFGVRWTMEFLRQQYRF